MFSSYYFTGELGKELLYLRQLSLDGTIPTVGMATSHEWLLYGPIYYWIMLPIYNLFNGNPFILLWVSIATLFIGVVINFLVLQKITNRLTAIYSSILLLASPLILWQTYLAKLHTFFFILSPLLMYFLWKVWNRKSKYVFWSGLIFGIMFSFHFSQIPLLLPIFGILYLKKYKLIDYLKFIVAMALPNLGIIFENLKIFLWLPYRVIKYSVSEPVSTVNSINKYFGRSLFWDNRLWIIGTLISIAILINYFYINKSKLKKDFLVYYLVFSISITLLANTLHSTPPIHYFLPIFTTLPILFALFVAKIRYGFVFIIILILINYSGYFKSHTGDDYVPLSKQIEISKEVIRISNDKQFSIRRIGPYDYFPENYSQNYRYLIYYYGGNLVEDSENIITIDENNNFNIK